MRLRIVGAGMGLLLLAGVAQAQPWLLPSQRPSPPSPSVARAEPTGRWSPQTALPENSWVLSNSPIEDLTNGKQGDKKNGNGEDKEKDKTGWKEEKPPENIKDNSFLIEEAYNQEAGVVQHIFNWVPTWDRQNGVRRHDFLFNYTMELPLGSQTHQFSFGVPFQTLEEQIGDDPTSKTGGVGDVQLNYRLQLMVEDECPCWPAVAPRFSVILPTGDKERGLGHGDVGYQFNLPISKQMGCFAFHFNAGYTFAKNVSVPLSIGLESPERDLRSYNLGASAIWLVTYHFNLMLECATYWNDDLDDAGNRVRTREIILNPGFRWAVFTGDEVQWVLGLGLPIGLSRDAPDIGVFGYMSVEHLFKKKPEPGVGMGI